MPPIRPSEPGGTAADPPVGGLGTPSPLGGPRGAGSVRTQLRTGWATRGALALRSLPLRPQPATAAAARFGGRPGRVEGGLPDPVRLSTATPWESLSPSVRALGHGGPIHRRTPRVLLAGDRAPARGFCFRPHHRRSHDLSRSCSHHTQRLTGCNSDPIPRRGR